ncbi:MAG: carbon storage regulator [Ruminococcus sp.]|jgi:carbon storage regulator CsrA|nr:carbon storage regulator [Ruminococcus sp.]
MLVIARKFGEGIIVRFGEEEAVVTVAQTPQGKIKLVIDAPRSIRIIRTEVAETEDLNVTASKPLLPENFAEKLKIDKQ